MLQQAPQAGTRQYPQALIGERGSSPSGHQSPDSVSVPGKLAHGTLVWAQQQPTTSLAEGILRPSVLGWPHLGAGDQEHMAQERGDKGKPWKGRESASPTATNANGGRLVSIGIHGSRQPMKITMIQSKISLWMFPKVRVQRTR